MKNKFVVHKTSQITIHVEYMDIPYCVQSNKTFTNTVLYNNLMIDYISVDTFPVRYINFISGS